jgi:hypothetical protein
VLLGTIVFKTEFICKGPIAKLTDEMNKLSSTSLAALQYCNEDKENELKKVNETHDNALKEWKTNYTALYQTNDDQVKALNEWRIKETDWNQTKKDQEYALNNCTQNASSSIESLNQQIQQSQSL